MAWHDANHDAQVFDRFKPDWIKLVRPEGDKSPFADIAHRYAQKHVLLRSHVVSENWGHREAITTPEQAIGTGNAIANAYKQILNWIQHEYDFSPT